MSKIITDYIKNFSKKKTNPILPSNFFDEVKWVPFQEKECPICFFEINKNSGIATTKCGHSFCIDCFSKSIQQKNNCPLCRDEIINKNNDKINYLDWFVRWSIINQIMYTHVIDQTIDNENVFSKKFEKIVSKSFGPQPHTVENTEIIKNLTKRVLNDDSFKKSIAVIIMDAINATHYAIDFLE
jgi:hypothetical protein